MKKTWILFLSISLIAMGCGSAEDDALLAQGRLSGSVQNSTTVTCPNDVAAAPLSACQMGGQFIPRSGSTPDLCKVTFSQTFSTYGGSTAPILTPSSPCGNRQAATYLRLRAGDRISIGSVSGEWGVAEYEKDQLLGFISYWSLDKDSCAQVSATGLDASSRLVQNEGKPAGLFASDGRATFFIGSGLSNHTVKNNGQLKLGFNIPSSNQSAACSKSVAVTVTVTRCEDTSGRSYACP